MRESARSPSAPIYYILNVAMAMEQSRYQYSFQTTFTTLTVATVINHRHDMKPVNTWPNLINNFWGEFRSIRAISTQYHPHCSQQNIQIQPHRPIAHIVGIVTHALLIRGMVTA